MTIINSLITILNHSSNWNDIYNALSKHNSARNNLAGKLFEEFCKYYYLAEPSIKNEYKHVWLFSEIPHNIKEKLNLGKIDHGIDLILEGHDSSFSAVQCKFRNDQNSNISWTKDNLANLFAEGDKADYLIVFTNASGLDKHSLSKKTNQLKLVTFGDLLNLTPSTIDAIKNRVNGLFKKVTDAKKPREYQLKAIKNVVDGFQKHDRGQLILPCGAGKTLVSLWIKKELKSNHTLVLVPSLALLRQIKKEWSINSSAEEFTPYMSVCSEQDINKESDSTAIHTYEIEGKVSTDPAEIQNFLNTHSKTIIYSTYHSLEAISKAIKNTGFYFDLAICDEAHKTSGKKHPYSKFGLIHAATEIPIKKRLYMTATPRIISAELKTRKDVITYAHDMDDVDVFGSEFYRMSFKNAIEQGILVDYQIVGIGISHEELQKAIQERKYSSDGETIDEIANNYALDKFMNQFNASHAITFHSSVRKAEKFKNRHNNFYPIIDSYHVNGMQSTNIRNKIMKTFEQSPKAIITNARCLTEGVDVPAIDVIYFCDPKNSKIDIVQAAGRALRRADHKEKKFGYIVIPLFHKDKEQLEKTIESSAYKNLIEVVKALCSHDERLVDEIKKIKLGLGKRKLNLQRNTFSNSLELVTLNGFDDLLKENLFSQIIDKIRVPWRNFDEAREYAKNLGLQNYFQWRKHCKNNNNPCDIPSDPYVVYKNKGWISWGDWLGTDNISTRYLEFLSYADAKIFVNALGLKTSEDWREYCSSGNKPTNIPSYPNELYEDEWTSMGDWLGTGKPPVNRNFWGFEEAKKFVHTLHLKNTSKWKSYCQSGDKPSYIPAKPNDAYKNKGWISWPDWLGTHSISTHKRSYRPFKEAREFIRSLGLRYGEWRGYCKSGDKPNDIPAAPNITYKNQGWISWGDWLGKVEFLNFDEAKIFLFPLQLKNYLAWQDYCKSGNKPDTIPTTPDRVYREQWVSWDDWLGTGRIPSRLKNYRPFFEARKYIHALNLKGENAWRQYLKSGNKPDYIPVSPDRVYKNKGWISWGDWLGSGNIASKKIIFRKFELARKFVHSLNLRGEADWRKYCKTGTKPNDIPMKPERTYKNTGWVSWGDWLGTGSIASQKIIHRPFIEARSYVHTLNLKSESEWRKYVKSNNKPNDIPACPNKSYKKKGWVSWPDWLGTIIQ